MFLWRLGGTSLLCEQWSHRPGSSCYFTLHASFLCIMWSQMSITCWVPDLWHVVSTALPGFFQPNQRPGSDSGNRNESIGGASVSWALFLIFGLFFLGNIFAKCFFGLY